MDDCVHTEWMNVRIELKCEHRKCVGVDQSILGAPEEAGDIGSPIEFTDLNHENSKNDGNS